MKVSSISASAFAWSASAFFSLPIRYRHKGQLVAGHRRTSALLPQQQSRHLSRIALPLVIRSFIWFPPMCFCRTFVAILSLAFCVTKVHLWCRSAYPNPVAILLQLCFAYQVLSGSCIPILFQQRLFFLWCHSYHSCLSLCFDALHHSADRITDLILTVFPVAARLPLLAFLLDQ